MGAVVSAVLVLGCLGFIFGAVLSYASKRFEVKVDPRIEQTLDLLPGANCGGCGFPGCAGLAAAIVERGIAPSSCPVLNADNRVKIEGLLGLSGGGATVKRAAFVRCKGVPTDEYKKFDYQGIKDCQAAVLLLNGPWKCPQRCIGLGSCKVACAFDAIVMGPNDLPIIDEAKCTSCGKCVTACPKMLIELIDQSKTVHVVCNSTEKGADTRKACKVGCIACKLCEKVCAYDAIKVENNLARIDYTKCVECGACVAKCPQKTIIKEDEPDFKPKVAIIDEPACIGCTLCHKVCAFQAIEGGTPKEKHRVITARCVGCGKCVIKCPKKCMKMIPRDQAPASPTPKPATEDPKKPSPTPTPPPAPAKPPTSTPA
jgi:Na+-translocating ferredoxin:NAD+ oxidoreductase subunit B